MNLQVVELFDDEEERTLEENLFVLSEITGRPYGALIKEYQERAAHTEFWSDPCWGQ